MKEFNTVIDFQKEVEGNERAYIDLSVRAIEDSIAKKDNLAIIDNILLEGSTYQVTIVRENWEELLNYNIEYYRLNDLPERAIDSWELLKIVKSLT